MSAEETSAILLSLKVGTVAVLMSLPVAIAIAYILARWNFLGRSLLQGLVDLPLVLPPVVSGYLLLVILAPNGLLGSLLKSFGLQVAFTWFGAAVASAVVSFPLMVRSIRTAIGSTDVRYELTARSLGSGPWRTFFTITLPLARHGIVAGCLLAFARSIGEFGATIMLAGDIPGETRTIPLAIYGMSHRPDGFANGWTLVAVSIALAMTAIFVGEWLEHRWRQSESS